MPKPDSPFLSVITICYNNAEGLKTTFDSIRKIKTEDVEYIDKESEETESEEK